MTKDEQTSPTWNTEIWRVVGDSAADVVSFVSSVVHLIFFGGEETLARSISFTMWSCQSSRACAFRTSKNKAGDLHHRHCVRWLLNFLLYPGCYYQGSQLSFQGPMPPIVIISLVRCSILPQFPLNLFL